MPNTLREAWVQALTLTLGVLRFHLVNAREHMIDFALKAVMILALVGSAAISPELTGSWLGIIFFLGCVFGLVKVCRWYISRPIK